MALLAYNKTASPLLLAAGSPAVTLPAATSAGARGKAVDVTAELLPNLTVDPLNGVTGGLAAADYALLEAQVDADSVVFEWSTGNPEFRTATLEVGAENIRIYVDVALGSDLNPGTLAQPLATFNKAMASVPKSWKRQCKIFLAASTLYTASTMAFSSIGLPDGPKASPLAIVGGYTNELGTRTETAGDVNGSTFTDSTLAVGVDAYFGYFATAVTGANAGAQRLIASNTATTFTVNESFFNPIAIGDTFVISKPDATITYTIADLKDTYLGIVGVELKSVGNGKRFSIEEATVTCEGVWFTLPGSGGSRVRVFSKGSLICGLTSNLPNPWAVDGADDPFDPNDRYAAGAFLGSASGNSVVIVAQQALVLNYMVMRNASWQINACSSVNLGSTHAKTSRLFCYDSSTLTTFGFDPLLPGKFDGSRPATALGSGIFVFAAGGTIASTNSIGNTEISNNAAGDAILIAGGYCTLSDVIGTGNLGYGVHVTLGGSAIIDDQGGTTTVTGTAGDAGFRIAANTKTYAALRTPDGAGVTGFWDVYGNFIEAFLTF